MNKETTYNFLWDRAIEPQIVDIARILRKLYFAEQDYGFQIRELDEYKETLYANYIEIKNSLKEKFFYMGINQYNKLKEKKQFYFPPTNLGHESYPYGRIKALALNDIYGIDFDLLSYADMMYWIEEYNKGILKNM